MIHADSEIAYKHKTGRSYRSLEGEGAGSKSNLHKRFKGQNPVENKFSLLRALHEDYVSGRKYKLSERQKKEVEAFLVFNQNKLYTSEKYYSLRQEQDTSTRECSPLDDWAHGTSIEFSYSSDRGIDALTPALSLLYMIWLAGWVSDISQIKQL